MAKPMPAVPGRALPPFPMGPGRMVRPPLGMARPMDMGRPGQARPDVKRPAAPKRSEAGAVRTCLACSAEYDEGERFCGECGTAIVEDEAAVTKKKRPSSSLPPTHVVPPGRRLDEWQAAIIAKSQWVNKNSDEASNCAACRTGFSVAKRKHHCRKCGQLFCAPCSSSRAVIPVLHSFNTQRLCDKCARDLLPHVDRVKPGTIGRSVSSLQSPQLEAAIAKVRSKSPPGHGQPANVCPGCHDALTEPDCSKCHKRREVAASNAESPRPSLGRSQSSIVMAQASPAPPSSSSFRAAKTLVPTPSLDVLSNRVTARSLPPVPQMPPLPDKPSPTSVADKPSPTISPSVADKPSPTIPPSVADKPSPTIPPPAAPDRLPDTPKRLHPSRPMMSQPGKSPTNGSKYLTSAEAVAKDSKVQRVVDYFVMFGLGALRAKESIGAGTISELMFEACCADGGRYPVLDWKECPLSPNAYMFAFPKGVRLYAGLVGHERDTFEDSYQARRPKVHQFVLTKLDGGKQYCSCLQFWDPWAKEEVKSLLRASFSEAKTKEPALSTQLDACMTRCFSHLELDDTLVYLPRAICLMSQQPQYTLFTEFLKTLYQIMKHPENDKPCERYITNLVHEIDLPSEGMATEFALGDKTIWFTRPFRNELPLADLDFKLLFRSLPPDLILMVYACLATEQKIVFCSTYTHVLVGVVECLCALLYPFEWQGVYMPLLPEKLGDFLYAPVPFIAGVHRSSIESGALDIPEELVFLDIDEADLRVPSVESLVYLPESICRKLRKIITLNADIFDPESPWLSLGQYAFMHGEDLDDLDLTSKPPDVSHLDVSFTPEEPVKVFSATPVMPGDATTFNITKIRKAFFDIWLEFLAPYKNFIRTPSPGVEQRDDEFFDSAGFINDAPKANRSMIKGISDTQMFARLLNDWMAIAEKNADAETLQRVQFLDENIASFKHRKSSKAKIEKALTDGKDSGLRTLQSGLGLQLARDEATKNVPPNTRAKISCPSAHFHNLPASTVKSTRFPTSLNPLFYEKCVRKNVGMDFRSQSTQAIDLTLGRNTNDQITDLALGLSYDFEKVRRVTVAQRAAAASRPPPTSPSGIIVSFKKEPSPEKKQAMPTPPPRTANEPPKNKSLVDRLAPSGGFYILTPEDLAAAISESLSRRQQAGNFTKLPQKPTNRLPQDRLTGQNTELAAMFAKQASLRSAGTTPLKPVALAPPKGVRPPQLSDQEVAMIVQKRDKLGHAATSAIALPHAPSLPPGPRLSVSLPNMPPPGRPDPLFDESADKSQEMQERKDRERKEKEEREKQKKEREEKEKEERERIRKEKEERERREKRERDERDERERKDKELREKRDRKEKEDREAEERDKQQNEEKKSQTNSFRPIVITPPQPATLTKTPSHYPMGLSTDKTNATIAAATAAAAAALALVASTNPAPSTTPKKPIIDAYSILTPSYTLDELRKFKMKGVDRSQREAYLTQEDFQAAFGMTRDSFYALPRWKRQDSKAKLGIF